MHVFKFCGHLFKCPLSDHALELPFNSMTLFIGGLVSCDFPLVILHIISTISFHLSCTNGGGYLNLIENSTYFVRFAESHIHFSTSWHAKVEFDPQ